MRWKGAPKGGRTDGRSAEAQEFPGGVRVDERLTVRSQLDSGSIVVRNDRFDLVPYRRIAKRLPQELDQCGWSAHAFDSSGAGLPPLNEQPE